MDIDGYSTKIKRDGYRRIFYKDQDRWMDKDDSTKIKRNGLIQMDIP